MSNRRINKKVIKNLVDRLPEDVAQSILTKKTYNECTTREILEMMQARQNQIQELRDQKKEEGANAKFLQGRIMGLSRHLNTLKEEYKDDQNTPMAEA